MSRHLVPDGVGAEKVVEVVLGGTRFVVSVVAPGCVGESWTSRSRADKREFWGSVEPNSKNPNLTEPCDSTPRIVAT